MYLFCLLQITWGDSLFLNNNHTSIPWLKFFPRNWLLAQLLLGILSDTEGTRFSFWAERQPLTNVGPQNKELPYFLSGFHSLARIRKCLHFHHILLLKEPKSRNTLWHTDYWCSGKNLHSWELCGIYPILKFLQSQNIWDSSYKYCFTNNFIFTQWFEYLKTFPKAMHKFAGSAIIE